ncbi:solute carrier protein [Tritrichomonas foetus]|uniref:Solute carrier protein n=1 Tax=Tritrichomonas foetus TaxID=1144522 RepID=A0A1J4JXK5_9EUKA|nr:solute carrier protein [Tritrichomonas foetus]|eukprot:OHT02260.1 solute carrier protein [Tritrichomonas foetus]
MLKAAFKQPLDRNRHLFKFFAVTSGIFVAYSMNSLVHENLYVNLNFKFPVILTLFQFLGYCVFSIRPFTKDTPLTRPLFTQILTASILEVFTKFLQNYAALKLSYPTETMFRSVKLLPVFFINAIFQKEIPNIQKIISIFLIVFGLILLTTADVIIANNFDMYGLAAAIMALVLDAIAANIEASLIHELNYNQVLFSVYIFSFFFLLSFVLVDTFFFETDPTQNFLYILRSQSSNVFSYLFLFMATSGISLSMQYLSTSLYGLVNTVIVTSLRKASSVFLSYLCFKNKKFTKQHFVAYLLLFGGIFSHSYHQYREKTNTTSNNKVGSSVFNQNEETSNRKNNKSQNKSEIDTNTDKDSNENLTSIKSDSNVSIDETGLPKSYQFQDALSVSEETGSADGKMGKV